MVDVEEENWRDREESLEFAVLEAVTVERAMIVSFCMEIGGGREDQQRSRKLFIRSGGGDVLEGHAF